MAHHPFENESNHLLNGLEENCPPPSQTTTNVWATLWKKHMLKTLRLGDPIMVNFSGAFKFYLFLHFIPWSIGQNYSSTIYLIQCTS